HKHTFIPFGPQSSYYATGAVPLHNEPFLVGDELLIYFNAFSRDPDHRSPYGSRSIGVAKLRRDGFAGLTPTAADQVAILTTKPVEIAGTELLLNVEQRGSSGAVSVALLDEKGTALQGYGLADCIPITQDSVRAPVRWKNSNDLTPLRNSKVKLSVKLS